MTTTTHPAAPAIPYLPAARVLVSRYQAVARPGDTADVLGTARIAYVAALEAAAAALDLDVERLDLLLLDALTSARHGAAPSEGPSAVAECAASLLALAIVDEVTR